MKFGVPGNLSLQDYFEILPRHESKIMSNRKGYNVDAIRNFPPMVKTASREFESESNSWHIWLI
jgi:hypothetical protein